MESGRLFFDQTSVCHGGNMLFLGNSDHIFRGSRSIISSIEENSKRRPFFSSPDELYDDEYYDEQLPEKKRRLSPEQVHLLEKSFETENKLEPDRKTQLAKKLGLQPRQVAVWFQNRRARWKTKQLERDYEILKNSYDSLLAKYDSTHKENEKLKSEMASLTEKVESKKEECGGEAVEEEWPGPEALAAAAQLSSGSGGSAVVDGHSLHYGIRHSEDDVVDDGRNYFSGVFPEEGETMGIMGWWVWNNNCSNHDN